MKIVVRIDRLVLQGIALTPDAKARVRTAVEAEIARLVGAGAVTSSSGRAVPSIAAPAILLARAGQPEGLGRRIAGSVHAAMTEATR